MFKRKGPAAGSGDRFALQAVHVDGRLEGLLLRVRARQTYRNEARHDIEAVYTFPLPSGATLLGLAVEIAGRRLHGTVVERSDAERSYEAAIEAGDLPVMVERSGAGLYTANLGNLKPGERAVIELEWAQLLRFEAGRLRLVVPTVIAARYGDPQQAGGLAVHQSAEPDVLARYPFTVSLEVVGEDARASIASPSHAIRLEAIPDGVRVAVASGAWLDRDFVLELDGLAGESFASVAPDGDAHVALASFCPALPSAAASPIRLKILVDCSGSMQGDSIEAARRALHAVLQALDERDLVSFSRFGGRVAHYLKRLTPCSPATIAYVAEQVSSMSASLGGTEMVPALRSTIETIRPPEGEDEPGSVCVLLITDGAVWASDEVVRTAAGADHRIFAVGVGSAPAESLLRELAERTGGACELVSPNEDLEAAIGRMFRRMRAGQAGRIEVDWGIAPRWQSPLPGRLYDGETVHVFAGFDASPPRAPALRFTCEGHVVDARPPRLAIGTDPTLARLGAATRIAAAPNDDRAQTLALALRYQLVTEQTHLLLVHVRADEEKAGGRPELAQVAQMPAAGHGGFGSVVVRSPRASFARAGADSMPALEMDQPAIWRNPRSTAAAAVAALEAQGVEAFDIPAFLRKSVAGEGGGAGGGTPGGGTPGGGTAGGGTAAAYLALLHALEKAALAATTL
ncbi:MAG: VIT and VWA domain-containing protein, partial [Vicinamibacterales bacterium]|nr:VIT and VWA domain-containing protein [Vicinamibacterales bacterium]